MDLIIIILMVLTTLIDIWAIISVFKNEQKKRFWWLMTILLIPGIGAITYFQVTHSHKRKSSNNQD